MARRQGAVIQVRLDRPEGA